ncbi:MAG TPA: hypothetical protein VKV02_05010, partial [Acidobacteriaceae bacterium]|nr:hypothetical protein [Acidobacteriaceae bacterium]
FGESIAVLDGNVERVLFRLLGMPESKSAATRTLLLRTANELVPPTPKRRGQSNPAGDHNQAMMELGATICLPKAPLCLHCPVVRFCRTRGEHVTAARAQLRSRRVAYLLATRKRGAATEVLLERRPTESSLMAGMLELPPLPLDAVEGREPVLRLRHSITNTNYYVEIFAESATGAPTAAPSEPIRMDYEDETDSLPPPQADLFHDGEILSYDPEAFNEDEAVYTASPDENIPAFSLRGQIPANEEDLRWMPSHHLHGKPLTGLTRKVLQRLGLMRMSEVLVRPDLSI